MIIVNVDIIIKFIVSEIRNLRFFFFIFYQIDDSRRSTFLDYLEHVANPDYIHPFQTQQTRKYIQNEP